MLYYYKQYKLEQFAYTVLNLDLLILVLCLIKLYLKKHLDHICINFAIHISLY